MANSASYAFFRMDSALNDFLPIISTNLPDPILGRWVVLWMFLIAIFIITKTRYAPLKLDTSIKLDNAIMARANGSFTDVDRRNIL